MTDEKQIKTAQEAKAAIATALQEVERQQEELTNPEQALDTFEDQRDTLLSLVKSLQGYLEGAPVAVMLINTGSIEALAELVTNMPAGAEVKIKKKALSGYDRVDVEYKDEQNWKQVPMKCIDGTDLAPTLRTAFEAMAVAATIPPPDKEEK